MNTNKPTEPGDYIWSVPATEGMDPYRFEVEVRLIDGELVALDEFGADFGPVPKLRNDSTWIKTPGKKATALAWDRSPGSLQIA